MKNSLMIAAFALLVPATSSAALLDFDGGIPAGLTLGGDMTWNGTGGGHLYMENWDTDDFIYFSAPTRVTSFQMNREPLQGYTAAPDDWMVTIEAFNAANASLWTTTLDLEAYAEWDQWLTVNVNTDNVSTLTFYATGLWEPFNSGFWPSIDNMVINEQGGEIPEPASLALLGLGLAGLALSRRRKV